MLGLEVVGLGEAHPGEPARHTTSAPGALAATLPGGGGEAGPFAAQTRLARNLDLQDAYGRQQLLKVSAQPIVFGAQAGKLLLHFGVLSLQAADSLRPPVLRAHQGEEQVAQAGVPVGDLMPWSPPPGRKT
ncbi:hypothetical protein ACISU4_26990 [Streptomyces wuyuanensis]|uniref:hypothetical protein n=1 Tax=Streptomyces wuyuanensis TaxID=1196353 RepID=UPI003828958B